MVHPILQFNCGCVTSRFMTNLSKIIAAYQQKHDVQGRELAKEIGIAASTLTRIKQGKMPDADGFAKIILWMTK